PVIPPPLSPTLFPYTTLFRSAVDLDPICARFDGSTSGKAEVRHRLADLLGRQRARLGDGLHALRSEHRRAGGQWRTAPRPDDLRSEEHTSELQSRFDLVCRLL